MLRSLFLDTRVLRETSRVFSYRLDGSTLFTFGTYTLTATVPAHKIMVGSVCMHSSLPLWWPYTQNPTSSGWLQSLLLLSRFCTIKKRDEIKYVCSEYARYSQAILTFSWKTWVCQTPHTYSGKVLSKLRLSRFKVHIK